MPKKPITILALLLCWINNSYGNVDKDVIDSLEQVSTSSPSPEERFMSERRLAVAYRQSGEHDLADQHLNTAIKYAEQAPLDERPRVYLDLAGDFLSYHSDFDRTISLLNKAVQIVSIDEDPETATRIFLQLGYAQGISGDTTNSDKNFLKAYETAPRGSNLYPYALFRVLETYYYRPEVGPEFEQYANIAEADTSFVNSGWYNSFLVMKYGYNKEYDKCDQLLKADLQNSLENEFHARAVYLYAMITQNYVDMGEYQLASEWGLKGLDMGHQYNLTKEIIDVLIAIIPAEEKIGNYKGALQFTKDLHSLRGAIQSREFQDLQLREEQKNIKIQIQQQELENQKKTLALQESEIQLASEARQKYWFIAMGIVFLILMIISVFAYRQKKKDNLLIEEQKMIVEEKNKEILDSISYAKRIQSAILPSEKIVGDLLPDSFVLYKPKDIVAGDFYWMEKYSDQVLFAAADCTGHGVPGAMVSVICNNGLNRSVREYQLTEPAKILDKTREIVIHEFAKSDEAVLDGMDIALCALKLNNQAGNNCETYSLSFSGAHNPLWVIQKDAEEVLEIKGDKQPIGRHEQEAPFTNHLINLKKGDTFYIFSDGYIDQFGGEKGKKFKTSNFKKLLLSIQSKSMELQKEIIDQTFEEWRGTLEQVDDVCIIGVRV